MEFRCPKACLKPYDPKVNHHLVDDWITWIVCCEVPRRRFQAKRLTYSIGKQDSRLPGAELKEGPEIPPVRVKLLRDALL
jgi:hypothetical protein